MEILKIAIEDGGERVDGEANTMIRHSILLEVVGSDLFRSSPRANLGSANRGPLPHLLLELDLVKPRSKHAHGLQLVLKLGFFILA